MHESQDGELREIIASAVIKAQAQKYFKADIWSMSLRFKHSRIASEI